MFENITKEKFKKIILFKYAFQLIFVHAVLGTILSAICLAAVAILSIWNDSINVQSFFSIFFGIGFGYLLSLFCGLTNILSVIPYSKLLSDCLTGEEEERVIIVQSICPNYELQTIREQKRFLCDTFSRKQNVELLLYDQDKNKYRLYWNENYGAFDETLMADNHEISILIRYFKRSKIVFSCNKIGEAIHESQSGTA